MSEKEIKKTVRVFFALWPNEPERAAIAAWQPPLQQLCGGRLLPAANLHNTLVFLGNVAVERMESLLLAAQEVKGETIQLTFEIARYWGHNQIVYAAPAIVPRQLSELVQELENTLLRHHFTFERRSYKPHITLLRHAHWADSPLPGMPPVVWRLHDFVLVQSVNGEQGVSYEVLARFPIAQ
jgi:RNA 2',3'-cyclic 3'-phosphodiesterase